MNRTITGAISLLIGFTIGGGLYLSGFQVQLADYGWYILGKTFVLLVGAMLYTSGGRTRKTIGVAILAGIAPGLIALNAGYNTALYVMGDMGKEYSLSQLGSFASFLLFLVLDALALHLLGQEIACDYANAQQHVRSEKRHTGSVIAQPLPREYRRHRRREEKPIPAEFPFVPRAHHRRGRE